MPKQLPEERMDRLFWQACGRADLRLDKARIPKRVWRRYFNEAHVAAQGYWHGVTGLVVTRLGITNEEWLTVVRVHYPQAPECLGDSCHDFTRRIERQVCTEPELDADSHARARVRWREYQRKRERRV